ARSLAPGLLATPADASGDLRVGHHPRIRPQLDEVGNDPVDRVRRRCSFALIAPRHLAPCMLDLLERSTAIVGALAARCATCAGLCGLMRAFVRADGSRDPHSCDDPSTYHDECTR